MSSITSYGRSGGAGVACFALSFLPGGLDGVFAGAGDFTSSFVSDLNNLALLRVATLGCG
jgi:hypothetical protein